MKKNEYLAPEMEIVEITEQCGILDVSGGDLSGEKNDDDTPDLGGF